MTTIRPQTPALADLLHHRPEVTGIGAAAVIHDLAVMSA